MAHYYVDDDVQEIADYVGDSYYLAKMAVKESRDVICFAGVKFMGESAKILNPERTVVMPDENADCPMAHMVDIKKIQEMREKYDDLAVVCYINSTAEIKAYSDVCVTSSNAMKVVKALPQKNIFFIPDENLGRYIGSQITDKNFIYNDGYCPVHKEITADKVKRAKEMHPEAPWETISEVHQESLIMSQLQMPESLLSVQSWACCMSCGRRIRTRYFTQRDRINSVRI